MNILDVDFNAEVEEEEVEVLTGNIFDDPTDFSDNGIDPYDDVEDVLDNFDTDSSDGVILPLADPEEDDMVENEFIADEFEDEPFESDEFDDDLPSEGLYDDEVDDFDYEDEIEIDEPVSIYQDDHNIILEKGDRIRVLCEALSKETVLAALVKGGNNQERATQMVDANFDYIERVYGDQNITPKKAAEIIMSIHEQVHGKRN